MVNTRKCKHCKEVFTKQRPLQACCGIDCAIAHANALKEKNKRLQELKSNREVKVKLDKLKTKQEHLKEAQRFFNVWIRKRDQYLPCISCQRHHTGQYHAGHYRSVGAAPHLRFNEDNVHKQCAPCNNHLSGNIVNYRINLVKKISVNNVYVVECDNTPANYTIDDIIAIKTKYKELTKLFKD